MNLAKSYEFLKPEQVQHRIHIIGCGAVGSTIAENLARFGITKITLWDDDIVSPHNVANQMFTSTQIGKSKVSALAEILRAINPEIDGDLRLMEERYNGQRLSGYVFLAVDNIDTRRQIAEGLMGNLQVKAMFDFRIRLEDAQHYAAKWSDPAMVNAFLASMQFSHEEAQASTPVSACNMPLSVCPTVRMIVAAGVANFVNMVRGCELKKTILIDAFHFMIDAF